ncbi:Superoxide dismutase [Solidesulfovibrio fructosivorans JJ]]|uniref:Superoxide dismutase n=1 Tax=Solidesulfovibrio fructosivorans JJ] TaxID=596151 RepID=E1JSI7_SOLFR|nr:superoxide dismutase [Solidesulfovibrio fructosivorans]EFL52672.1 Superoxide dismutase [Solidesulfovibrio fructosivorans JJ]]
MRAQCDTSFSRRNILKLAAGTGLMLLAGGMILPGQAHAEVFAAPPLPYPENALEPVISGRTVSFHYGKHTLGYFNNANKFVAESPLAGQPLDKVFLAAAKDPKLTPLFNNAAQAWNHVFYWNGLKSGGGGAPTGKLAKAVDASFGSAEACKKALATAATSVFGSGWAWLVADGDGKLKVVKTGNAGNPMQDGLKPLWVIDVWEHAYYLDYQNRRADYVAGVLDKLVNWDFAAKNMG